MSFLVLSFLAVANSGHSDLEGLVLDREVRALRDQFVTFNYSKVCFCQAELLCRMDY